MLGARHVLVRLNTYTCVLVIKCYGLSLGRVIWGNSIFHQCIRRFRPDRKRVMASLSRGPPRLTLVPQAKQQAMFCSVS